MTARTLILTAILLSAPLAGCLETVGDGGFNGIEYRNPPEAPDFTLLDQNGQNVSLSDYDGKVVILAFIYTSCPDVCLIISSNLQWAKMNLPEDMASEVAFLSVTIDPAKDTVDRLSRWTKATGYDWPHLTSNDIDELVGVWSDWNVVVDNDHINASTPPDDTSNRIVVMGADGSTTSFDTPWGEIEFQPNARGMAEVAFERENLTFDYGNGTIIEWTENESLSWSTAVWDSISWAWIGTNSSLDNIPLTPDTHLAFVPNDANLSLLPPGVDCNGHGWVMGKGSGAHCMCDEGWKRPNGDWLSCVSEGGEDDANGTDPHEESLGEYQVGHTTATFIIDKDGDKRVAWGGVTWDPGLFLMDIEKLVEE